MKIEEIISLLRQMVLLMYNRYVIKTLHMYIEKYIQSEKTNKPDLAICNQCFIYLYEALGLLLNYEIGVADLDGTVSSVKIEKIEDLFKPTYRSHKIYSLSQYYQEYIDFSWYKRLKRVRDLICHNQFSRVEAIHSFCMNPKDLDYLRYYYKFIHSRFTCDDDSFYTKTLAFETITEFCRLLLKRVIIYKEKGVFY